MQTLDRASVGNKGKFWEVRAADKGRVREEEVWGGLTCSALQAVLRNLEVSNQSLQATQKPLFSLPSQLALFCLHFLHNYMFPVLGL